MPGKELGLGGSPTVSRVCVGRPCAIGSCKHYFFSSITIWYTIGVPSKKNPARIIWLGYQGDGPRRGGASG
jgi:hypothetical protein